MGRRVLFGVIFALISVIAYAGSCRCLPSQVCWPSVQAWSKLSKQVSGRLIKPILPLAVCAKDQKNKACKQALKAIKNPFYMQSKSGNSESQGWLNAWKNQASTYAVEAKNTKDVAAAVNFARKHNLRLVIKGAGHDYLGRSSSPDSLLIWTHNMRKITYHSRFMPKGCKRKTTPEVPAITVGAGARWIEAYTMATTKHHQYVQGGGCTTVGAAGGFTQGGGFGSFSKRFGTGAAGVLQVQVVTANGKVVIANQCKNKNLFWAIRGGGGGTFGVVTKMTLRTHPLPKYFGLLRGTITANGGHSFKMLITRFLTLYAEKLNNKHWGEQFTINKNNTITFFLMTQNLSPQQVTAIWQPLKAWIKKSNGRYSIKTNYISIPPTKMWDLAFWEKYHPSLVVRDTRKNARPGEYWWAPNSGEVYEYWYTYQSRWIPMSLFDKANILKTTDMLFNASRYTNIPFHINKGLGGASTEADVRGRQTSTNPKVYNAAALVIMGAGTNKMPLATDKERDSLQAKKELEGINAAMKIITKATPGAGTYANEADYFQKDWQQAFWSDNYNKLLKIKQQYDPNGLFYCHHCVGSEQWQKGGMCRK
jgi:FAD/FMN-containing dehydrogenase